MNALLLLDPEDMFIDGPGSGTIRRDFIFECGGLSFYAERFQPQQEHPMTITVKEVEDALRSAAEDIGFAYEGAKIDIENGDTDMPKVVVKYDGCGVCTGATLTHRRTIADLAKIAATRADEWFTYAARQSLGLA